MSAHTPGKWKAEKIGDWWDITSEEAINPVAIVGNGRDVPIFLAAPDMLEALKGAKWFAELGAQAFVDGTAENHIGYLNHVIAKATSEPA